jgi:hypothetical protein
MSKWLIAVLLALFGFSQSFAQSSPKPKPSSSPVTKQEKNCKDFAGKVWEDFGFSWPASYKFPTPQEACDLMVKEHPDTAKSFDGIWPLPYAYIEYRLGQDCVDLFLGDAKNGKLNQPGGNIRWGDYATRKELLAVMIRLAVPALTGMCAKDQIQQSAATALLVANTAASLEAVKLDIADKVSKGQVPQEWFNELDIRIKSKIDALKLDPEGNKNAISFLTGVTGILEKFLRENCVLSKKLSTDTLLVFIDFDGKECRRVDMTPKALPTPQFNTTVIGMVTLKTVQNFGCLVSKDDADKVSVKPLGDFQGFYFELEGKNVGWLFGFSADVNGVKAQYWCFASIDKTGGLLPMTVDQNDDTKLAAQPYIILSHQSKLCEFNVKLTNLFDISNWLNPDLIARNKNSCVLKPMTDRP